MGEKFKIEHGVELPLSRTKRAKYPFGEMQVGDSFAFDSASVLRLKSAASYFGIRNNREYSIRLTDPVKNEYRCWRIK